MRTTVRLPDDLMKAVKRYAVETDRTLTDVIEEALRSELARRRTYRVRETVRLPTYGSGGLRPGVDLDDGAGLLDLMDGPDDST